MNQSSARYSHEPWPSAFNAYHESSESSMKASCWFRVAIVKGVEGVGGEGRKSQRRGQTTK